MAVEGWDCRSAVWLHILNNKYYHRGRTWDLSPCRFTCHPLCGKVCSQLVDLIQASAHIGIGYGQKCLFWMDRWCEGKPLEGRFCKPFTIANDPLMVVGMAYDLRNGVPFKVADLLALLQSFTLDQR